VASSAIEGICESRFLGVREAFAENFAWTAGRSSTCGPGMPTPRGRARGCATPSSTSRRRPRARRRSARTDWPTGGSIGFADPGAHIGFGYTMNQMQPGMPPDPRAIRMIDALYASL
jgi:hypothetical protein